ncbi:DnaJ-domain-containing protein [Bimuria novae-zelandiae CBS 107.79]|uniref:DnaJ-domain-containing protein n=1 Tax=Bimuria novae-zelandiae CBS 107.79 TaxID=1447943 RepID=A0A6A5VB16_9PLEO|nr:DnaJ-domain-containing protein [Bimuria novae-zelandiae CBS 107.79]
MPLQPRSLLPRRRTSALWICASCLARTSDGPSAIPLRRSASPFHSSATRPADAASSITHYDILELPPSASPAEIKRQFYTLSKKHHPDHNASDPDASTRFVAISEAYHTLSSPEKRAKYDAQISRSQGHSQGHSHGHTHWARSAHHAPSGSHFGSRPASGLNKKRSTFRGPPPSFYKAGGYGAHAGKRAEYAQHQHQHQHATRTEDTAGAGADSYGGFGEGYGPGQAGQGYGVPHFDDRRHKQMHDTVYEHISARRRRAREEEIPQEFDRGGMLANFLMVSGVVGIVAAATKLFSSSTEGNKKAEV